MSAGPEEDFIEDGNSLLDGRDGEGEAAQDKHARQRHQERRHLEDVDEESVDESKGGAAEQNQYEHQPGVEVRSFQEQAGEDAAEADHGSDGQVDAAGEDDEGEPDGGDAEDGGVAEEVEEGCG